MAENTIDNLSIQVTASADKAASVFDRLASSAGRLRGAASGAAGGMQDMAQGARDTRTAIETAGEKAGQAQPRIRGVGNAAKDSGDKAKKGASGLDAFWQSLKRIAYYRFIRSIIREIGAAFNYGITNLYAWSNAVDGKFASSMDTITTATNYLKNSLGAMVSPLINALAPALDFIIDKIVDVLNWFNQLFAVLSGASTYTAAKKVASTWADAGKSVAGSAKKAADDIKRTILGFDEINKLVDNKERGSGSGGGYSQPSTAGSVLFEERPLTSGFKGFSNAIENALNDTLSRIGLIISGATLAVGAILTFSGANVPLGLSLMAAGASGLVSIIGMNWNGLSADVKLAIGAVEAVIGGSLLAIGGILAFSGVKPALGIAMMAAGAVSLTAAVGLNWDLITGKVSASAKGVAGALSAATAVVGAILTFTGVNAPLGIALMATGITGAAVTLNWDYVADKLRGPIGTATAIVSGASLVLGILALIGGAVPLGIGLIVAGAAGLASTVAANWNNLKDLGKKAIESVKKGWESVKLAVTAFVSLAKKGWTTLTKWVGDIAAKGVSLVREGWTSLTKWVGDIAAKGVSLAKKGWTSLTSWVGNISAKGVALVKKGWTTLTAWVGDIAAKGVKLAKDGWTSITSWVGDIASKGVKLFKDGWTTLTSWVGEIGARGVSLVRDGWTTIADWAVSFGNGIIDLTVTITEKVSEWFRKFVTWINGGGEEVKVQGQAWGEADITVNAIEGRGVKYTWDGFVPIVDDTTSYTKVDAVAGSNMNGGNWWSGGSLYPNVGDTTSTAYVDVSTPWSWWEGIRGYLGLNNLDATAWVDVDTPWWYWGRSLLSWLGMDNLSTTVTVNAVAGSGGGGGGAVNLMATKAKGGIFSRGTWSDIPQYASGRAGVNHGSLFWAGENGAEIVGNVGGRTEVLNRSQIASAMYSAVQAAMAPAAANFASAAESMGSVSIGFDIETLAEMVRQGVEQAMSRSNDYDRQKVDLLRQINDKDFTAEVTSNDINNAQRRMNRRAGTTVVAVG